jgi:NTE family protein
MHSLNAGPNVVVHFGLPKFEPFDVDYDSIPGRWALLRRILFARHKLPKAPGPVSVLRRCLFSKKSFDLNMVGPHDLVLSPPPFPGSSFLDFDHHTEVFHAAYRWALEKIDELTEQGDPALAAILQASALGFETTRRTTPEETPESKLLRSQAHP